jgi:hypothetical protein
MTTDALLSRLRGEPRAAPADDYVASDQTRFRSTLAWCGRRRKRKRVQLTERPHAGGRNAAALSTHESTDFRQNRRWHQPGVASIFFCVATGSN